MDRRSKATGIRLYRAVKRRTPRRLNVPGALLAMAAILHGCESGTGLTDGLLQVANLSRDEATLTWQSPGILGTPVLQSTESEAIPSCDVIQRGFGSEDTPVSVTTVSSELAITMSSRNSGPTVRWVVIAMDGSIKEVPADEAPASPYCRDP